MPLSPPVGRQHLHTRRVTCQGFFREDGLWDIEGHITDEKTYEHSNEWRGPLKPGDFVHDMSIRLTVDHRFTIVDVEAVTDKSPYQICGNVAPDFKKLIGLRIGGGFHRKVKERLGGVHGCTHIVELLGPVATTAFQTVSSRQGARAQPGASPQDRQTAQARRSRRAQSAQALRHRQLLRLGRRRRRWSGAGRRTSIRAPTPKRCAPRRPAKTSRWTADAASASPSRPSSGRGPLQAAPRLDRAPGEVAQRYDFLSSSGVSVVSASACRPASSSAFSAA